MPRNPLPRRFDAFVYCGHCDCARLTYTTSRGDEGPRRCVWCGWLIHEKSTPNDDRVPMGDTL
jgi:hypothetical protein